MTKVLVTGASGFIGRQCVPLLASKSYEVHAVARRYPPNEDNPNVCWHEADLLVPGRAADLIREVRPDSVLHLAWYAEPGKFWQARENIDWVRASLELLGAFADYGGKRIVGAGSCAEYGSSTGECVESATPLLPTTLYGASKHSLEQILRFSGAQTGLAYAWGRIFFLYGPYEHSSRLVAYAVRSLLRGEPALCSDGTQIVDLIHVEDAAAALVALLQSEIQGPVNIGSGSPIVVRDVLQEIGRQTGRADLIRLGARPSGSGTERLWANTTRLREEVGWSPRFELAGGIAHTIEWWRNADGLSARLGSPG